MSSSKYYTVDDLITSVIRRATIPISDTTISNDDLIRFANEEMSENLVALILSCRQEIYLTYEDIQLQSGQQFYNIPYRAIGAKVRIIKPLMNNNVEGSPLVPIDLQRTFNNDGDVFTNVTTGFYLIDDKIVLLPNINGIGTNMLRVYYYFRPNDLVSLDRGAKIKSINFDTNQVTVESVPLNINSSTLVDIIQSKPNHKVYEFDQTVTVNSASKVITFGELPDDLEVGDYVCTAGETVTPQIPVDIIPVLEQSVVCKVLEAIGDTEGLKNAYVRLQKLEARLLNVITNRIEAPGTKIVNNNGLLRGRWRYGGTW